MFTAVVLAPTRRPATGPDRPDRSGRDTRRRDISVRSWPSCAQRGREVQPEFIGHRQGVAEHVGQLVGHFRQPVGVLDDLPRLFRGEPLEVLHQFGRFNGHRHGKILRRVEAVPVAPADEVVDPLLQLGNGRSGVGHEGWGMRDEG